MRITEMTKYSKTEFLDRNGKQIKEGMWLSCHEEKFGRIYTKELEGGKKELWIAYVSPSFWESFVEYDWKPFASLDTKKTRIVSTLDYDDGLSKHSYFLGLRRDKHRNLIIEELELIDGALFTCGDITTSCDVSLPEGYGFVPDGRSMDLLVSYGLAVDTNVIKVGCRLYQFKLKDLMQYAFNEEINN